MNSSFHIHLVSDSTGDTIYSVARACIVQFANIDVKTVPHNMVRSPRKMQETVEAIEAMPGLVLYTLMNTQNCETLERECARLSLPCINVLDGVITRLGEYFGQQIQHRPGKQYELDARYFDRIEAIQYVLAHDDGQMPTGLQNADVILVGVSRTSKTPTSVYLANQRGIKAANVPFVPGVPLPPELFDAGEPFIVGLTNSADRLVQIRRQRLRHLQEDDDTDYVDPEQVRAEIQEARRLFNKMKWPVIDVSRRSIEETAAEIFELYANHLESKTPEGKGGDPAQS